MRRKGGGADLELICCIDEVLCKTLGRQHMLGEFSPLPTALCCEAACLLFFHLAQNQINNSCRYLSYRVRTTQLRLYLALSHERFPPRHVSFIGNHTSFPSYAFIPRCSENLTLDTYSIKSYVSLRTEFQNP